MHLFEKGPGPSATRKWLFFGKERLGYRLQLELGFRSYPSGVELLENLVFVFQQLNYERTKISITNKSMLKINNQNLTGRFFAQIVKSLVKLGVRNPNICKIESFEKQNDN